MDLPEQLEEPQPTVSIQAETGGGGGAAGGGHQNQRGLGSPMSLQGVQQAPVMVGSLEHCRDLRV